MKIFISENTNLFPQEKACREDNPAGNAIS
jgi:hypothetical protein